MSKKDKLKKLIWKTISSCGDNDVYETKLWKLLFFIEADFYEKYNETITGVKYLKNIHGPTPDYKVGKKALDELVESAFIVEIKDQYGIKYRVNNDYDIEHLSSQQIDSINNTCDNFSGLSVKRLSILSHNDPVYLMAEKIHSLLDFGNVKYRSEDEMISKDLSEIDTSPIKLETSEITKLKKILAI